MTSHDAEVIITSKTKIKTGRGEVYACVGGLLLDNFQSVRLLGESFRFNDPDTYNIGEVWRIRFTRPKTRSPHVEDICITSKTRTEVYSISDLKNTIMSSGILIKGQIDDTFQQLLQVDGKKRFISEAVGSPTHSTEFWINEKPLSLVFGNTYEEGQYPECTQIKYVGFPQPVQSLPSGSLIRLSLATWWCKSSTTEERCYLQLSGWY